MIGRRLECKQMHPGQPLSVKADLVLGPFRHSAEYLKRSTNGLFSFGDFSPDCVNMTMSPVYRAKMWFHATMSIINFLNGQLVGNVGSPPILRQIVFRYIPKEGVTVQDVLQRINPDDPDDMDYTLIWGYEIYLILNELPPTDAYPTTLGFVSTKFVQKLLQNQMSEGDQIRTFTMQGGTEVLDEDAEPMKRGVKGRSKLSIAETKRIAELKRCVTKIMNGDTLTGMSNEPFRLDSSSSGSNWFTLLKSGEDFFKTMLKAIGYGGRQFSDMMAVFDRGTFLMDEPIDGMLVGQSEESGRLEIDLAKIFGLRAEDVDARQLHQEFAVRGVDEGFVRTTPPAHQNGGTVTINAAGTGLWYLVQPSRKYDFDTSMCPFVHRPPPTYKSIPYFLVKLSSEANDPHNTLSVWGRYHAYRLEHDSVRVTTKQVPAPATAEIDVGSILQAEFELSDRNGFQCITTEGGFTPQSLTLTGIDDASVIPHEGPREVLESGNISTTWEWTLAPAQCAHLPGAAGPFQMKVVMSAGFHPYMPNRVKFWLAKVDPVSKRVVSRAVLSARRFEEDEASEYDDTGIMLYMQTKREYMEEWAKVEIRSKFQLAWDSSQSMSTALCSTIKHMEHRSKKLGDEIRCPPMADGSFGFRFDSASLPAFFNYLLVPIELYETCLGVRDKHHLQVLLRYVGMHRNKMTCRPPHTVVWGMKGEGKSFMLDLLHETICPEMMKKVSVESKMNLFSDCKNIDEVGSNLIHAYDECWPGTGCPPTTPPPQSLLSHPVTHACRARTFPVHRCTLAETGVWGCPPTRHARH